MSRVHASTVDHWWRAAPDGEPVSASFDELTDFERFQTGGPWMDAGLCQEHLAQVLESGQWPLVAVDPSGRVVGEVEVVVGPDPDWGPTAHVDVLAVERGFQGRGIGAALMEDVRSRALRANCATISTNPEEAAVGFYRKCGLTRVLCRQVAIRLPARGPVRRSGAPVPRARIDELWSASPRRLALGRFHPSYATWIKRAWTPAAFADRLAPEEGLLEESGTVYRLRPSPLGARRCSAYAWVDRPAKASALLRDLGERAGARGFDTLETTVDVGDREEGRLLGGRIGEETILIGGALPGTRRRDGGPARPGDREPVGPRAAR
ncbi:MAG TPA: GNAT family N-acetyltransferase [Thermoplasmata archaeon]|nr:GNAT family N-acetyltransferase [Thermoplasmata archaeon]